MSFGVLEIDGRAPTENWDPLPLAPFEAMMVADERPGASMTCSATFYFDGEIERQPYERATEIALQRHRLLRAVIRGKGKQRCWHPTDQLPPVYWNRANVGSASTELPQLDLTKEPGYRCWINVEQSTDGESRSILRYDFHHACCDAIGGILFFEDVMTIYDGLVNDKPTKLRPIDKDRVNHRSRVPFAATWFKKIYRTFVDLRKSIRLISTNPLPLPNLRECQPWSERFIVRHLPEEDLVALRYAASDVSASLNDFLLVEFLCLLRDWVGDGAIPPKDSDHIRVVMPMSLRDRDDLKLEAANKIGFSFLSRSLKQLKFADTEDWNAVISGVSAELDQAKRLLLPAQFLKKLRIACISQRWFQSFFSDSRCWGTAILTQLGDPTRRFYNRFPRENGRVRLGNLLLTDFVSCGPLRPQTHAILSTNAYGNELTLSMRCDPEKIARETAEAFLDEFVLRVQKRVSTLRDTKSDSLPISRVHPK